VTAAPASDAQPVDRHYALVAPRRLEEVQRTLPPLDPDWVRVRMAYCGLCGSDLSRYTGRRSAMYPVSLGHEWVGVVDRVGARVHDLAPGDVVTTDLNFRCGACRHCRAGRSHLCLQGRVGRFTNRGFATRADIHASYLHRCTQPPAPHLALAEPLACAMHALSHCHLSGHDRALVVGAGSLGLCLSFLLSHGWSSGGFDVTDVALPRLDALGRAIGAAGRAVAEPTEQYDVVLDVSGTAAGLRSACERVSPGGRLCTMSHLPDRTDAGFLVGEELQRKDVTLVMSYLDGPVTNLTGAIQLLEGAWSSAWDALVDVRPLADLHQAFEGRESSPANKIVIEVPSSAEEGA
jgi:threonine dehydrogenase-like Zn-dependent dehydrogenase